MNNNIPEGFEYHYPEKLPRTPYWTQNWFINFETKELFLASSGLIHNIEIINDGEYIVFGDHRKPGGEDVQLAYMNFIAEKELLE